MDPFKCLPEEIYYLILQHLTVDELLNTTEVSKQWYFLIGNSKIFSRKVWVNVDDRFAEPSIQIVKLFQKSERIYENFKISELGNGLDIIFNSNHKWKMAQIDIQSFILFTEYAKILSVIEKSINVLDVFDMDIQCNGGEDYFLKNDINDLNFTKLHRIYFGNISPYGLIPFIDSCRNLKTLILDNLNCKDEDYESKNIFKLFLNSLQNLKHLQISAKHLNWFTNSTEKFSFLLDSLFIDFSSEYLFNYDEFQTFIANQNMLKWIKLSDCSQSLFVMNILTNCKNLKRLSLEYFDKDSEKFDSQDLQDISNCSIMQLDLECENLSHEWIVPLVIKLHELESIYIFHITEEIYKQIHMICKKLRVIKYCSIYKSFEMISKFQNIQIIEEKLFLEECKL